MIPKKKIIALLIVLCSLNVYANTDSLLSRIKLSSYFETYYTYDFGNALGDKYRNFVNHNKNNEIAINLALLNLNYATDKFRANIGVMIGTYTNANFNIYDQGYKNIYESNVGIRLHKKHNLWFDVGIFPSHIGAESVIGKNNWTLTRSLQAEASPYYEAGARLSYTSKNNKLYANVLALNGWQIIQKSSNYPISFGTHIQYKPNSKILFNSSSYLGNNNAPLSSNRNRYFHNFYSQIKFTNQFALLLGFDIGIEEYFYDPAYYVLWHSPLLITRYTPNNKHAFAFRAEYLNDGFNRVFRGVQNQAFEGTGFSLNYDYSLNSRAMLRIEGKMYNTTKALFVDQNFNYGNTNNSITTAFIFHLND